MATTNGALPAATVEALYRYPVKGLSPQVLAGVTLRAGETIPFDRMYAIENGPCPFDPGSPTHLPKNHFFMLMRHEQLAALQTEFDTASHALAIWQSGSLAARGHLREPSGRATIEGFIAHYMAEKLRGAPRIVSSGGHNFTDIAQKCLHIVNRRSVLALETLLSAPINALRFRPNMILDGLPAWSELDLIGQTLTAGDAKLEIFKRTERCAATNVDPETGARDMKLPPFLSRMLGHASFGVYARVVAGGDIAVGDRVSVSG